MRKALAVLMIVLFAFPLIMAALMSFSVSTWALDRGFFLRLVSDERIYEAVLRNSPWEREQVLENTDFHGIPGDALAIALREVVTPNYLRSQAVALVNDAFDAIEGRARTLELSIDLTPLKDRLLTDAGYRFSRSLASNLPFCAPGEESVAPGAHLPRCRRPDRTEEQTAESIADSLPAFVADLPDRYPEPPETVYFHYTPEDEFWMGFVGTNRFLWAGMILSLIAACFWVGAAFVAGENRHEIVQWLGWSLFVPAALTLICGIAIRIGAGWPWVDFGPGGWLTTDAWYGAEVAEVLSTVIRTAIKAIARGFLVTAGISLGISLGLIVWSFSIQTEEE
jgi:hypothetical protein